MKSAASSHMKNVGSQANLFELEYPCRLSDPNIMCSSLTEDAWHHYKPEDINPSLL